MRYAKKFEDHRRDPTKHPEPVLFNHVTRYVYVISKVRIRQLFYVVYVVANFRIHHLCNYREPDESDTTDTDDDSGWGGLGIFEYSTKGLPHALVHATDLVETFGHHGACCTCVGEAGHKANIKQAALFSRTYASKNTSQDSMLEYVQRQHLWSKVLQLNKQCDGDNREPPDEPALSEESADYDAMPQQNPAPCIQTLVKLLEPLDYVSSFNTMVPNARTGRPPPRWGGTFFSKRVLITRTELLTLLRTKLDMAETWENITRLATQLD